MAHTERVDIVYFGEGARWLSLAVGVTVDIILDVVGLNAGGEIVFRSAVLEAEDERFIEFDGTPLGVAGAKEDDLCAAEGFVYL